MSILSVRELFGVKSSMDNNVHSHTREFLVISSIENESVYTVETAAGIPKYNDFYSCNGTINYGALCNKITVTQDKDVPTSWAVVCEFKPKPSDNNKPSGGGKPDTPPAGKEDRSKRLPSVKIDTIEREVIVSSDLAGKAIMSSTNEPILCTKKVKNLVVTISYWDWWLDSSKWIPFQNTINKSFYWGYPAHTWKVNITAEADYDAENSWIWWHKTFVFENKYYLLKPAVLGRGGDIYQTWDERPIDMGYLVLDASYTTSTMYPDLTKLVHAKDYHGNPVRERVLLDGAGRKVGSSNCQDTGGLPTFCPASPFLLYAEMDFSALPMSTNFNTDITAPI